MVSKGKKASESTTGASILVSTMADTTWRMFVPSIGFTLVGVWLDSLFQTKPFIMIAGIIVGFSVVFFLIKHQLSRLKPKKEQRDV